MFEQTIIHGSNYFQYTMYYPSEDLYKNYHSSNSSKHHSKLHEHVNFRNLTKEAFYYTQRRPYGLGKRLPRGIFSDYVAEQIPCLLQEREYKLGTINKIFASKWLNDKQVVFGTKCNQLVVMEVRTGKMINIPTLRSSEDSLPAECPCGIHSVAVNPSRTMLATGANNTNDIAVYKLPTFDPVCVGEFGHTDWVFDLVWIDDEFLLSGSRDNQIALWKIDDSTQRNVYNTECGFPVKHPVTVRHCEKAQKVRALAYHEARKEVAALSLNAYFHLWDMKTFTQLYSKKLYCTKENVCLAVNQKKALYAVGSQSAVTLVDPRSRTSPFTVMSKHSERGIRSVSFNEEIITIGTGYGMVLFYDLRACKYIEHSCGHSCYLNINSGWLKHDENYRDYFSDGEYPNAIYTHCYDESGTRLFAAGGPLPAGLWGNYAGLWY